MTDAPTRFPRAGSARAWASAAWTAAGLGTLSGSAGSSTAAAGGRAGAVAVAAVVGLLRRPRWESLGSARRIAAEAATTHPPAVAASTRRDISAPRFDYHVADRYGTLVEPLTKE